jgi:hypothetical protein
MNGVQRPKLKVITGKNASSGKTHASGGILKLAVRFKKTTAHALRLALDSAMAHGKTALNTVREYLNPKRGGNFYKKNIQQRNLHKKISNKEISTKAQIIGGINCVSRKTLHKTLHKEFFIKKNQIVGAVNCVSRQTLHKTLHKDFFIKKTQIC